MTMMKKKKTRGFGNDDQPVVNRKHRTKKHYLRFIETKEANEEIKYEKLFNQRRNS